MDTESLLRESRCENLLEPLGFQTEVGKTQFKKQLRMMTSNIGLLQRRQEAIQTFGKEDLDPLFQEIQTLEPDLEVFFKKTEVEKDSYEQLLFSSWKPLQILNTSPFLLLALSIFKQ
jgi:hypothetical protein